MKLVSNASTLNSFPELGMGYQFCRDGSDTHYIVLHSLIALEKHEIGNSYTCKMIEKLFHQLDSEIDKFRWSEWHYKFPKATAEAFDIEWDQFELENSSKEFLNFVDASAFLQNRYIERRLHESPPFLRSARSSDRMYRYSIVRNDPRISPNGAVTSGTYATTSSDANLVASGFGAVGRYALPGLLPRCYKFNISPPDGVSMQVGACQPNFGEAGGGVEVEFSVALPPGSASFETALPEL